MRESKISGVGELPPGWLGWSPGVQQHVDDDELPPGWFGWSPGVQQHVDDD